MPENKTPKEPLDDATLTQVVGGASDEDIAQNCDPPPPPQPPASTSSDGDTGN